MKVVVLEVPSKFVNHLWLLLIVYELKDTELSGSGTLIFGLMYEPKSYKLILRESHFKFIFLEARFKELKKLSLLLFPTYLVLLLFAFLF